MIGTYRAVYRPSFSAVEHVSGIRYSPVYSAFYETGGATASAYRETQDDT
jgi:hypothetical protein